MARNNSVLLNNRPGKVYSYDESSLVRALESIPDSVAIASMKDSIVVWANQGFTRLTGYLHPEIIGHSTLELAIWVSPAQRRFIIQKLESDGRCNDIEALIRNKNGDITPVLISGTIIEYHGESCAFLLARNISEQVQTEQDLQEERARYQAFISQTSDAIVRFDLPIPVDIQLPIPVQADRISHAVVMECNDVAARLYGYDKASEIIGKRYDQLVDVDSGTTTDMLQEFLRNDYRLNDHVFESVTSDGKQIFLSVSASGEVIDGKFVRAWVRQKDITDKKHTEDALLASEEKFSQAFHASPDAIVITDMETREIVEINEGLFRMLGYSPTDIVGANPAQLGIYDAGSRQDLIARVSRFGKAYNIECEACKKNGEVVSILMSSTRIDLRGRPCMLTTMRDITQRKASERDLARFEEIVSAINDSIIVIDDEYRYEYANRGYREFIGIGDQHIIGRKMNDVLGKEAFDLIAPALARGFKGENVRFERWRETDDGKKICNEVHVSRFKNSNDNRWSLLSLGRDISERKQAEEALRRNERRYRSLIEATHVIPWELDTDCWRPTYIGPQVTSTFGYPIESWYDDDFWLKYIDTTDRERVIDFYESIAALHQEAEIEYRLITAEQNTVWVRDIVHLTTDESGRSVLQGIMVDITETKERDSQLAYAQKMEAVGRLTGGIAHDFNNLLTIIRGNLGLIHELTANKNTDAEFQEIIGDAVSAADDGSELTEQLLAFSRKQSLKPQSVSINDQIEVSARMFRRMLGEDIEFTTAFSRGDPVAFIDPYKFGSSLLNLAINARDAMPTGGTLEIKTERVTFDSSTTLHGLAINPGRYVSITVTDNGVGMDAETVRRACEPFFTTKGSSGGSGLGLSMVYGFVSQSGGAMQINSRSAIGTSVSLFLPEYLQSTDSPPESEDDVREQMVPRGAETILVVEDDYRLRKFAARSLQSLGYQTLEAANADEAMQYLKTDTEIDVLFSDNILPGAVNGRELASWAQVNRPTLHILLTTGYTSRDTNAPDIYDGQYEVLKKPYTKEQLATFVRKTIDTGVRQT